ncbi:universal stress protein [Ruegeria sp. 2012CJ41-6]|uniref:Universal stress protein n=1 Tax=Ruegeria spongiae TaxID=2942209 RepID=A0ABT0PZI2_9RHOB|nr:universal stress protein [Ruegeria spongiae]MCL6282967.1 universal stress protein [Ruegeria spongiae]
MYHNILVPIAFEAERDVSGSLKLAQLLATPDARITLLHVVEHIPAYAISYIPSDYLAEMHKGLKADLDAKAAELPNASGVLIEGHAGRSILDWADEHHPDLIIIASHRPELQDLLLGSTAAKIVRHARCAAHVVR